MLPKEKTPKKAGPDNLTILIYGPTKIGKSTLCSNAPGALFLATEAGLNHLEVFQVAITSWEVMLEALAEISAGQHNYKTIIIDTIDNAYKMCTKYICDKAGIVHESDLDWGKGWSLVSNEFQRVLTKLSLLPYGLIMVSHSEGREQDAKTGKYIKQIPTLPKGARQFVLSMVDLVLYCETRKSNNGDEATEERILRTKPCREYEAGDRTGKLPETLPLSYEALASALRGTESVSTPAKASTPLASKKTPVTQAQTPGNVLPGIKLAGQKDYAQFIS